LDLAIQRALRLQATVRYAAYWLMGQGGLYLLVGDRLSGWLRLRYEPVMDPYLRLAGLSLLCLGFFLLKSLRDARRQYLAVNALVECMTKSGMTADEAWAEIKQASAEYLAGRVG
jgi:hypothetical protein